MKYYTIHNSDGDTDIQEWTKDKLEKAIEEKYWGDIGFLDKILPGGGNTHYWDGNILIIRGEIVCPNPVETVVKMELR